MISLVVGVILTVIVLFIVAWVVSVAVFTGEDHSKYDLPRPTTMGTRTAESTKHAAAAAAIAKAFSEPPPAKRKELLQLIRSQLDRHGAAAEIGSEIHPTDADGVKAEWVIAPNADPAQRLLYIHGGGYVMGSPKSSRPIANRLSESSESAVLSIDYRLMPEHSRMAGIEDCRTAYKWILNNGPDGQLTADTVIVAGDSSGGNLALSTIAWVRDSGLRSANAVVALCPQTDATLGSPSLSLNAGSDVMQGTTFGPIVKAPKVFSLWWMFLMHKTNPSSPLISPLLDDLSNLPPTLLQASESEMFLDDAIRYANKANAQGTHAEVQTWPYVMHVWHAFQVPEADEAFAKIEEFLGEHVAPTTDGD